MFENKEFILNPITRSTILFWASKMDEQTFGAKQIRKIMEDIEPYPEF